LQNSTVNVTYKGNSVNNKTLAIKTKSKYTFKAEVCPSDAVDKTVTWESFNGKQAVFKVKFKKIFEYIPVADCVYLRIMV